MPTEHRHRPSIMCSALRRAMS